MINLSPTESAPKYHIDRFSQYCTVHSRA